MSEATTTEDHETTAEARSSVASTGRRDSKEICQDSATTAQADVLETPMFMEAYNRNAAIFKAKLAEARQALQNSVNEITLQKSRVLSVLRNPDRVLGIHINSLQEARETFGKDAWKELSLGMIPPIHVDQDSSEAETLYNRLIHEDPACLGPVHDVPREKTLYAAVSYKHLPRSHSPYRTVHNQKMRLAVWHRVVASAQKLARSFKAQYVVLWVDMALRTRQADDQEAWMVRGLLPYFVLPVVVAMENEDFGDVQYIYPKDMDQRMWLHVEQRAGGMNVGLCLAGQEGKTYQEAMEMVPSHLVLGQSHTIQSIWDQAGFLLGRQTGMLATLRNLVADALDGRVWERQVSWEQDMLRIVQWLIDHALKGKGSNVSAAFTQFSSRYAVQTSFAGAIKLWEAHWHGSAAEIHDRNLIEFGDNWYSREVQFLSSSWNSFTAWMPGVRVHNSILEDEVLDNNLQLFYHRFETQIRWVLVAEKDERHVLGVAMLFGPMDAYPGALIAEIECHDDGDARIGQVLSYQKFYPRYLKFFEVIHCRLWAYTRSPTSSLRNSYPQVCRNRVLSLENSKDVQLLFAIVYEQTTIGKRWLAERLNPRESKISVTALVGNEISWT